MTNRYRSKPQIIEAVQWTGENWAEISEFADVVRWSGLLPVFLHVGKDGAQCYAPIQIGYWIVRSAGDDTDYWPVEDSYFRAEYEPEEA